MSGATPPYDKPLVFISYSHMDEPDEVRFPDRTRWLSFVRRHLKTAEEFGRLETWDDRRIDEVLEIADQGPMKLHMADAALERARLAFARIEGQATLAATPPAPPDPETTERLRAEAATQIETARALIDECGYGRRRPELEELDALQAGTRRYADLPPRI